MISFFRYPYWYVDRENSDTNSDSSDESFYDPKLATDSVDFSDADFNVIDDDKVDDINNIIFTDVLKSADGTQIYTQDIEEQLRSRRGIWKATENATDC